MMHEQIRAKLMTAFNPSHLEVVDESYRHNVPVGTESHFKVVIVSSLFADQRLLSRHRQIYTLLQDELAATVHALALHTFTENQPNHSVQSYNPERSSVSQELPATGNAYREKGLG